MGEKDKEVTLEEYALRWLAKCFKGYAPIGCLTDVVNLSFAILGKPPATNPDEHVALAAMQEMKEKASSKDIYNIWLPTHLMMDAEYDDCLCWLLLEYLHRLKNTELEVLIQLPANAEAAEPDEMEGIVTHIQHVASRTATSDAKHSRIQIFRDRESGNAKALIGTWRNNCTESEFSVAKKGSSHKLLKQKCVPWWHGFRSRGPGPICNSI